MGAYTGTFVGGSNTLTTSGTFSISGSATRTIDFTSSTIACATWTATTTTGLTFTAPSTLTQNGSGVTFAGGALTYNTVSMTGAQVSVTGANNYTTLTRTGTAALTNFWAISGTQTVSGTLTINANSAVNRMFVRSATLGTNATISAGTLVCTNVIDFQDITGAGAATWTTGASGASLFGDALGNSGITMTTPTTQTATGTASFSWSTHGWTTHVPLPQDTVIINNAFIAGRVVTSDMPRLGKDISFTGATGTPTWDFSSTTNFIYGSVTLISAMSISGTQATTFNNRSSVNLTSASRTFTQAINIQGPSNTVVPVDSVITNGAITCGGGFIGGSFDASVNNVNVTCLTFTATFGSGVVGGTGTWHLTSTAATTIFGISGSSFTSANMTGTTIVVDNTSANTRTITTAGNTNNNYGTIQYTVAGSTGILAFTNNFTGQVLRFSDATNARNIQFAAGITVTIPNSTGIILTGTSGKLTTIVTDTGGSPWTLAVANGLVSVDFVSLKDSTASGNTPFYAGANSTNVSGNTNWTFAAAPVVRKLSALGVG